MPDEKPANPLDPPLQREPVLPAAAPPQPAASTNGDGAPEAPQQAPRAVDATVGTLVATVDQLSAEVEALRKQARSNSRSFILLFGAVVYLTYVARGKGFGNVADSIPA